MNFSNRNLIIFGSIAGAILIIGAVLVSSSQPKGSTVPDERGYKDPGSGEILKNDKAPQGPDAEATMIFPGFSKLIDRGLSPAQVQSIEGAIKNYAVEKNKKFKEVSLQVDSVRRILPQGTSRTHGVNFDIVIDRSDKYHIMTAYENTDTIRTKLYTADKKTLLFEQ